MSTLCRAGRKCRNMSWQKNQPRKLSRFCLTHLSAFLKGRVKGGRKISDYRKYFGNISEKQPFSEKISDLFFWEMLCRVGRSQTGSSLWSFTSCRSFNSQSNRCCSANCPANLRKCINMNDLQNKQPFVRSRSVKLGQTTADFHCARAG